jgi:hypothetical protein|tara:strand:- start:798 stop:1058 length:261 start_codon:yes stop_codon:yes gene_type:complete
MLLFTSWNIAWRYCVAALACLADDASVTSAATAADDAKAPKDKNTASDFFTVFMPIPVKIKTVISILNNRHNIGKVYYAKVKINKD